MKILIFSEEYIKVTKGMYSIWITHASHAVRTQHVHVLLNREHWAFDESSKAFRADDRASLTRLPFRMPSTLLGGASSIQSRPLRLSAIVFGHVANLLFSPLIVFYLWVLLRRAKPSAVFSHAGGWPAGDLGRWIMYAARLARIPSRILVIHSHPAVAKGIASIIFAPLRLIRAWSIEKCVTAIVTVSDSVKAALESEVFGRAVIRIHNGIDASPSTAEPADFSLSPGWRPSGLVVGFVGALAPMKGVHVLLDAFKSVNLPCELVLVGPGDSEYLKTLRQRAGLCTNKVSFLGFQSNVDWFMARFDLLVVPSVAFESFGMVILEAMKHSKAVICSDFGGMKEVVDNGVTGLVVPAGDALALSMAITGLLTDSDKRLKMGAAGRARLNALFTAKQMVAQYGALIQPK